MDKKGERQSTPLLPDMQQDNVAFLEGNNLYSRVGFGIARCRAGGFHPGSLPLGEKPLRYQISLQE